jgi:hypothetical protein
MVEQHKTPAPKDSGLRRMMTWVIVALIATLALTALVVEITLRWFNS